MCKSKTGFVVVYVFGPTRCKEKYGNNEVLSRDNGEWVKIGQTEFIGSDPTRQALIEQAVKRCNQETRTGISDWCSIYDVFVFPHNNTKVDDAIRNLLCNEIYSLDNSKNEVSNDKKGDIAPGREYVYGLCRSNIKHAVESYDHSLITKASPEELVNIQTICIINDNTIDSEELEQDDLSVHTEKKKCVRDIDMILSPGDVVYLTDRKNYKVMGPDGCQITATYKGNRKFEYDGVVAFSSKLAADLINQYGHTKNNQKPNVSNVCGNEYWTDQDGNTLKELFEQIN